MDDLPRTTEASIRLGSRVQRGRNRVSRARLVLLAVLLAAAAAAATYWYINQDLESTDDAYTDGRAITVAPQVSGMVTMLAVDDNQRVKAGETLLQIDPSSYIAARDQVAANLRVTEAQLANARLALETSQTSYPARLASAQAQLAAAEAARVKADADARRQANLPRQATTQQDIDTANANKLAAQAQVDQAQAAVRQADMVRQFVAGAAAQVTQLVAQVALVKAQLDQAELNLSWTKLTAPQDGWITKRNVEKGTYVQPGQALFAIVAPEVWITANFKESQLNRMRAGQKVDIRVDAYPDLLLQGHVDSVQLGSGTRFTAFPPENATGNFVKIVQRVPVKIVIDSGMDPNLPLPLGLSVDPTVHLK